MMFRYLDIRTNPEYKYDQVLGDINYNFSLISGSTFTGGTVSGDTDFLGQILLSGINIFTLFSSVDLWSASTGLNSIIANNGSGNLASGPYSSIIAGTGHTVTGRNSVIIGGGSINGTANDTVYVPYLNLQSLATGTSVNTLGLDSSGNVVSGTSVTQYWISGSSGPYSIKAINDSGLDSIGDYSIAEGFGTLASGYTSHAEGYGTKANGDYSHAEGTASNANGITSHAEGDSNNANGNNSHAEGAQTIASGAQSHSEGQLTQAIGANSHSSGVNSIASGDTSFIHGSGSTANGTNTVVFGLNIIGNQDNTVYVPNLNIGILGSGTSVNTLGIDVNGNVVTGIITNSSIARTFMFMGG